MFYLFFIVRCSSLVYLHINYLIIHMYNMLVPSQHLDLFLECSVWNLICSDAPVSEHLYYHFTMLHQIWLSCDPVSSNVKVRSLLLWIIMRCWAATETRIYLQSNDDIKVNLVFKFYMGLHIFKKNIFEKLDRSLPCFFYLKRSNFPYISFFWECGGGDFIKRINSTEVTFRIWVLSLFFTLVRKTEKWESNFRNLENHPLLDTSRKITFY